MSTLHIATAAFVKVSIGSPSGNRVAQLIQRGSIVPAGVAEEQIEHLVARGLIEAVEPQPELEPEVTPEPTPAQPEPKTPEAAKVAAAKPTAAKQS